MVSISNNEIKKVKSLSQKKFRDETGLFTVEGDKMVDEAVKSSFTVEKIYKADVIGEDAMARITALSSPSPVLAVVRKPSDIYVSDASQLDDLLSEGGLFLALDTIRDFDFMGIYNKDMSGIVKNDAEVCKLMREAGNIAGYENLPYLTVSLGATDAAAISKSKKMKAAAFAAMDPAPARYYHTRLDTHENLDMKTLEAGLGICLETAFLYDEKGLNV